MGLRNGAAQGRGLRTALTLKRKRRLDLTFLERV